MSKHHLHLQIDLSLSRKTRILMIVLPTLIVLLASTILVSTTIWQQHKAHAAIDNPNAPASIGINLNNVSDYSSDYLFADAFKTWRLEPAPGHSSAPSLDSNGWPQGDFGAFLWDHGSSTSTVGTYALRFTGQANLSLNGASGSIHNQYYDSNSNTTTATIVINQGGTEQLNFTSTKRNSWDNPGNGVTNVQLMRPTSPGSSSSYSFNTTFTDQIKQLVSKFSVIRFMDYSATNGNGQTNWWERRLPQEANQQGPAHNSNSYGWEGLGAAWEYAIQLCNETNRDAYINIPELATGTWPTDTWSYIYNLALLFKYGSDANGNGYTSPQSNPVHPPLNGWLHLYVEYSNEVWNGAFVQFHQNLSAVQSDIANNSGELGVLNFDHLNVSGPDSNGNYNNQYVLAWRRQAMRIAQASTIFRAVFGDNAMMSQVRPLLEWQFGNGQATASTQLSFLYDYYNNGAGNYVSNPHPVNYYLWGGGGAVYSSVNNPNAGSIDAIYNSGIDTTTFYNNVVADVNWGRAFGLHEVAYEGGFNIGGDNPSDLQKQANLDSRSNGDEQAYQWAFTEAGGDLLMYFNSSGYSAYGLADPDVYNPWTPKLSGIGAINANNQQPFTNGISVPATIAGNNWSINSRGWGTPNNSPLTMFGTQGDPRYGTPAVSMVAYTLRNPNVNYAVTMNYTSSISTSVLVYVTGKYWGSISISPGTNQTSNIIYFNMPIGVNSILLAASPGSADFTINSIQIG